ncbi:MAG: SIS domain-containing protein [Patescibacteria group bacterium]
MAKISDQIFKSIQAKIDLLKDFDQIMNIDLAGRQIIDVLNKGNKILIAGNGGSAADAQHFSAELAGKFISVRKGLPAVALTTNSSNITAIANDFGYDQVFVRQLEALAKPGDVFFGISTSGNSENLIKALEWGRNNNLINIGLLGKGGGKMKDYCDVSIIVPSDNTQNIQESHIMIIHILCQMIDEAFSGK